MTGPDTNRPPRSGTGEAREALSPRARPQPVTRINRKVVIGGAALLLCLISFVVLLALRPPSLRVADRKELINVEHKPIADALAKLPATYASVRPEDKPDVGRPPGVPTLKPPSDPPPLAGAGSGRMAAEARASGLFFRLRLKPAPKETEGGAASVPRTASMSPDRGPATPSAPRAAADAALVPAGGDGSPISTDIGTADQTRKLAFLKSGPDKEIYNPHGLQTPISAYQLMAGTVIAASLVTGLNSDLPGFVIAQVTENVYDTVSGRFLVIPQGSRLIGRYDNIVAFGQERALVVWQRITLPDGSSVVIDNLPATDTGGYAGLADQVDLHTWKLLKGVALATVLGVSSELAFGSTESDLVKALQQSTQSTTNRAGQRLVERNLNVQPSITVRPGWPLRLVVHKDLVLRPYRGAAPKLK